MSSSLSCKADGIHQKGQHHKVEEDVANFLRTKRGGVLITTEIIQAKVKEVSNVVLQELSSRPAAAGSCDL